MDTCDVVVVGGGPAGSSCAWGLRHAGLDVVVVDRARFPRDKVCAGWVTPQVLSALDVDVTEYAHGRTLQPTTGFRVGRIGRNREAVVRYDRPVSYGIRRCEFDHFLLNRSGARVIQSTAVDRLERHSGSWIVNGGLQAPMLVGACDHLCPAARALAPAEDRPPVVAAQEIEVPRASLRWGARADPELVDLYFTPDLTGYGWCFPKQAFVNIGFGRYGRAPFAPPVPDDIEAFAEFLNDRRIVGLGSGSPWRGHAYRLGSDRRPRVVDDGVLLVGDAAGLAYPESGEGIRPAVESGLLAAQTIVEATLRGGRFTRDRLSPYERRLTARMRHATLHRQSATRSTAARLAPRLAPALLASTWLVRHLVLDRWFVRSGSAR
ncbi:MAG: NAD(P)/FAD-dependent oxidoreductase [Acidimicrobiia bacterium]|nr:NAD(P)/FAD-dependent oxidoreductase [Acidimicrobiia bacterium]